jgi:trehalose 6-phosphate synthase
MWTRDRLQDLVTERLAGFRFICVANREPYIHVRTGSTLRCIEPDSGVVAALDPVMRTTGGTWIAHGGGSGDRETADARGRLRVPPGKESYALRRIWLTAEQEDGYYYGFSNGAMWPLCHIVYQRPSFEKEAWNQYVAVNRTFADAVLEEIGGERAVVFIQDYHFALLSKFIKEKMPGAIVFQFWHIPWPNSETFRICPWRKEILEGLLGNDLLAFHIQHHCNNFLEAVDRELEARIDRERTLIAMRGSSTLIRPHPISVDTHALSEAASSAATAARIEEFQKRYHLRGYRILLSVGRLDYTKGILERLAALDRLLTQHPEYREKVVLVEIGIPSRSRLGPYSRFQHDVESAILEINSRYRTPDWDPVVFFKEHQDRPDLLAWYRMADACLVTSLHDGMNLVAKEFVAARSDEKGVLVLSPFTGAARELTQALLANPYAPDDLADILHAALRMPEGEQRLRMAQMRETVRQHNVYRWAGKLLEQAARLEPS